VWDDNGLDVPELFLPQLLNFLGGLFQSTGTFLLTSMMVGHASAYVRSASAAAIAEAAEHWPQAVQDTVDALQDFYRDKAGSPRYAVYESLTINAGQNSGAGV
jgi:hypothetical protein